MSERSSCSDILFYRYFCRYEDVHPERGTLSEMLFLYWKRNRRRLTEKPIYFYSKISYNFFIIFKIFL